MSRVAAMVQCSLVAAAGAAQCATVGGWCGAWQSCCGGAVCKQEGFMNWRCGEECVREGQTCGGPGLPDSTCCDGMQCERHLLGTSNKQCVRPSEPQCKGQGQICGCSGCLTQACCGGFQCAEVSGQGGKLYCVDTRMSFAQLGAEAVPSNVTATFELAPAKDLHRCVAEGQTCGGPGLQDSACCDGMQCERHLLGTSNKQCVRPSEPQCKGHGQICGCTGCLTQACCGGFQCAEVSGQGGKLYCVDILGSFVRVSTDPTSVNGTASQAELGAMPSSP